MRGATGYPGFQGRADGSRIVALAARLQLPAVYPRRVYVGAGGLVSYGFDVVDQFRRATGYVDRVLKGEKPAALPVQTPTKISVDDQPEDRQNTRPNRPGYATRVRRRGDRVIHRRRRHGRSRARGPQPAMPVIGYFSGRWSDVETPLATSFASPMA
jgi:hypothetical protein